MTMVRHLEERYLNTDLHKVWVDEETYSASFALWNLSGQLVGRQKYNPLGSKKTNDTSLAKYHCTNHNKSLVVWGLESFYLSKVLFVTEGVFDAARLTYRGYSAVALLSANADSSTKNWLWLVEQVRPVVFVYDNDAAGKKFASLGKNSVSTTSKDLGDSSDEEVTILLANYEHLRSNSS